MECAAKKLKNSHGASLVLALVFLLVCVMVGSSVLMAASSNAGRSRSNRQEQQLYLVLSSALQLVADDLTGAEYTSQVKCERTTISAGGGDFIIYYLDPQDGGMDRENGGKPLFADVFYSALKSISDGDIKDVLQEKYSEDFSAWEQPGVHHYFAAFDLATKEPQSFTLTVTAADAPLAGYTAQVDVKIDTNYRITLTARLTAAPDDKALELFRGYSLTTTLTRSGTISLDVPEMEEDGVQTLTAGTITWKAGKVLREYRDTETLP